MAVRGARQQLVELGVLACPVGRPCPHLFQQRLGGLRGLAMTEEGLEEERDPHLHVLDGRLRQPLVECLLACRAQPEHPLVRQPLLGDVGALDQAQGLQAG